MCVVGFFLPQMWIVRFILVSNCLCALATDAQESEFIMRKGAGTIICLNGIKIRVGAYIESSQFIPEEKEGQQTSWHLQTNISFPHHFSQTALFPFESSLTQTLALISEN